MRIGATPEPDHGDEVHVMAADLACCGNAEAIHAVQMAAYRQEADLLQVADFPPLRRSVEDLRSSEDVFFVAVLNGKIVGAVGVEVRGVAGSANIASLVVSPAHQRRGIGRLLLTTILRAYAPRSVTVSTGATNRPAVDLYRDLGFKEYGREVVGPEGLHLILLRRPGTARAVPG